ncbi:MAG: OsmC family protein [Pseudomonadota bacterium]
MSVKMHGTYIGKTRVKLTHESGAEITTCAPKDNGGDGSLFSPTDLVAASAGACILTVMGLVAERHGIPFEGASFRAEKTMSANPRRIGKLEVEVTISAKLTDEQKKKLEAAAYTCPVKKSLDPAVEVNLRFIYS